MTAAEHQDDHPSRGDDWCDTCQSHTHFHCFDTDLDLTDAHPLIALHDAALAVTGEQTA